MSHPNPEYHREYQRQWRNANPERRRETRRKSYENNREAVLEYARRYYEANRERKREYDRERRATRAHGITREQRDAMYAAQGEACAGCREPYPDRGLEVDHDHACCEGTHSCGQCVRGLLCRSCNKRDVLATQPIQREEVAAV